MGVIIPRPRLLSNAHQPRINAVASKAILLHTRRLGLQRFQRPLRAQACTHSTERAHRALLLHKRHRAPTMTTAATATSTPAHAHSSADGKLHAKSHGLLHDVSRNGVICVLDAGAKRAVRLRLGEEHGREEAAYLGARGRDGVA